MTVINPTNEGSGKLIQFPVEAGTAWQLVELDIPLESRLYQIRIDVNDGPGSAVISDLTLQDKTGKAKLSWPE